jgi:hypothetical protein
VLRFEPVPELEVPRLRPRRWLPILGTLAGAAAGFAFYWFYGCDSG